MPNRPSGRIAFLFLLFLGVLLSNYYGASVVSVRLSQPPEKMNDSLYSLAISHMTVASESFRAIDWFLEVRSQLVLPDAYSIQFQPKILMCWLGHRRGA